jgi:hypothetical protein
MKFSKPLAPAEIIKTSLLIPDITLSSFPDITLFTPQRNFTFNVEATGRLGVSARLFVKELYRASGRLWKLDNNLIGPCSHVSFRPYYRWPVDT